MNLSTELREGDRVYELSRPRRTGVVVAREGRYLTIDLDEPEIRNGETITRVQSAFYLWRKA